MEADAVRQTYGSGDTIFRTRLLSKNYSFGVRGEMESQVSKKWSVCGCLESGELWLTLTALPEIWCSEKRVNMVLSRCR